MIRIILIVLYLFVNQIVVSSQTTVCENNLLNGFIIDGQEYTLNLEDSNTGKIYLTFFDGFQYRIVICSESCKKYKITLFDIEKKVLFSGSCENYTKFLDLKFTSNIACFAEIVTSEPRPKQQFKVVIGFKESNTAK